MKHELSDMLAASKENPPPPRYTVEDALAAGRKRQSRRRVLLTGAGSAAAVVAVAAAIAVPQIVTRNSTDNKTTTNAAPAASAPKKQTPFAYPADDFTGNIAPFKSGDLTVSGTVQVTSSYQVATIVAPGTGAKFEDAHGKIHTWVNNAGNVVVYRKGVYNPALVAKTGTKVKVNSGPLGYYIAPKKQAPIKPGFPAGYSDATVAWQYAGDSWAVVTTNQAAKASETDMINLAQKVTSDTATAMKVDFKLSYVPKGFTLEGAGPADYGLTAPMQGQSFLRVVKGTTDYTGLTGPILDAPVVGDKQLPTLTLDVYPAWYSKYTSKNGMCVSGESLCYKSTADGKFAVELMGGGYLSNSELLKILKGVTFADPTDTGTWFTATTAVS